MKPTQTKISIGNLPFLKKPEQPTAEGERVAKAQALNTELEADAAKQLAKLKSVHNRRKARR